MIDEPAVMLEDAIVPEPDYLTRQGDKTTLGLGLAVVARIIKNMNGQLRLKSEEGKGSRFVIQFPFELPDSEIQDSAEEQESEGSKTPQPETPPQPETRWSRRSRTTRRCGCGRQRRGHAVACSRAIPTASAPSPSRRAVSWSRRPLTTTQCGCGRRRWGRAVARSRAIEL